MHNIYPIHLCIKKISITFVADKILCIKNNTINLRYLRVVKIIKRIILGAFMGLSAFVAEAQDVHFTQFYAMPLLQNPANTGFFTGDCRANAIYRNQWQSVDGEPYSTIGLSFDKQFFYYTQQISAGAAFVNDRSGYGPLSSTKFYLSGSYMKLINRHKIFGGVQAGIIYKYSDINKLTFDNQYDHGGDQVFNPDFNNGEEGLEPGFAYFNLNVGVAWSRKMSDKFIPKAGIALSNLTRPNESFSGIKLRDTSLLAIKKTIHIESFFGLGSKFGAVPRIMYISQKKASNLLIGGNLEYYLKNETVTALYAGTVFRYGWSDNYDASAWIIGARFKQFDVSFSYDINISQLQEATKNRGAFEIALQFICPSTQPVKIKVPCDRY